TTRSIAKARTTITTIVTGNASATGSPRSIRPTSVRAANSTITPWAKLKTPEALKINTKPSATSEYISPANTPPISTSTKNAGLPAMSANGLNAASSVSIMGDPEVGVEDRRVLTDLLRSAVGDLAAVVEHGHPVRDVHDHAHVVLDQRDRGGELGVDVEDE